MLAGWDGSGGVKLKEGSGNIWGGGGRSEKLSVVSEGGRKSERLSDGGRLDAGSGW